MRHKCPHFRDTDMKPADLGEGVTSKQTMRDTSDLYDKGDLERSISEEGKKANNDMLVDFYPTNF